MRILLVTTSQPESAWLLKAFQESAHSLQRVDDLRDAAFVAGQEVFDAIVLMSSEPAPHVDLLSALPNFTRHGGGAAILVITTAASPQQRTKILRAGADACFCQPISYIELHERMLALYRASPAMSLKCDYRLALDASTREFVAGNERFLVTRREYMLLECLLRQPNAPVARDQLMRYAWPDEEDVDPSSVNLVVSRLRRKLADHTPTVQIETVSRFGYQITAPLR
ncbi:response regulator transcription factor [Paraburkholderia sp. Tr-20389]|uniref:response regulator transcription factor n=1 Tax=Paraburkholderia sp. Tr-20389 TaxID=2703903 RepID=UPI00197CBA9F|nr:response regulator transcription factor [Paraburkholderia sp. Tr-20389]MBN3754746.1 response regulator transcription factor [Paraburkholderia sp. Tr-20389]